MAWVNHPSVQRKEWRGRRTVTAKTEKSASPPSFLSPGWLLLACSGSLHLPLPPLPRPLSAGESPGGFFSQCALHYSRNGKDSKSPLPSRSSWKICLPLKGCVLDWAELGVLGHLMIDFHGGMKEEVCAPASGCVALWQDWLDFWSVTAP